MRLIDADELKTAFPCGESVRTESVRATIDHMATVDAEPVRHGHWINENLNGYQYWKSTCSKCGWYGYSNYDSYVDIYDFAYCPNCGAKMDEEEK